MLGFSRPIVSTTEKGEKKGTLFLAKRDNRHGSVYGLTICMSVVWEKPCNNFLAIHFSSLFQHLVMRFKGKKQTFI